MMHGSPGQQSAVVVQAPPAPTQMGPHTSGGTPASGAHDGLGTHGKPQQSALVAQACPARDPPSVQGSPFSVQRGIPRMSCWQTSGFWLTLPAQQLFSALHDITFSLQMAPAGLQAIPLSQRPTGSLAFDLLQWPVPVWPLMPSKPQQSESPAHTSPVGRQPLGGWQTSTPSLNGAHARLQQSPPQAGTPASFLTTPPSAAAPAPQTSPANAQPGTPGGCGEMQSPNVVPCAFWQIPLQQSKFVAHTSLFCAQNDPLPVQRPFWHTREQQSPWLMQALPAVRQDGLSGLHVPAAQLPPQHCADVVQAWLSEVHCVEPHMPPLQTKVQQF
jgi:hypothetical protein